MKILSSLLCKKVHLQKLKVFAGIIQQDNSNYLVATAV